MSLKDVKLNLVYDSSKNNIEEDVFIPLMIQSKTYYRGVGFFSSSWLKVALDGVERNN